MSTFEEQFPTLAGKPIQIVNFNEDGVKELLWRMKMDVMECCLDKKIVRQAIMKTFAECGMTAEQAKFQLHLWRELRL